MPSPPRSTVPSARRGVGADGFFAASADPRWAKAEPDAASMVVAIAKARMVLRTFKSSVGFGVVLARAGKQLLARRQHDRASIALRAAVLRARARHRHDVAELH